MRLGWLVCLGGIVAGITACGNVTENADGQRGGAGGMTNTASGGTAQGGASDSSGGPGQAGASFGGHLGTGGAGGADHSEAGSGGDPNGSPDSGGTTATYGGSAGKAGASDQAGDSGQSSNAGAAGSNGGFDGPHLVHVPADYPTIQGALDATDDGDTISVSPGTYLENILFNGKATRLVSEGGPGATIIDGDHAGPVVEFNDHEGPNSTLEGFTLRNGSAPFGGGVTISFASPTIRHNIIENCSAYGGSAGIGANASASLIDSNLFRNNSCDSQFGSGVLVLSNSSSERVVNNVFIDNDCRALSMALPKEETPEISNNTFVDNRVAIYVWAQNPTKGQIYRNNLIWGGNVGLQVDFGTASFPDYGNAPAWDHNLVFGSVENFVGIDDPAGTGGNLTVDPKLVDPVNGNVHLLGSSPAVDAGTSAGPPLPSLDFDGAPRSVDGNGDNASAVDIGAIELQ